MPFIRVAGDMTIALNSGSVNTGAEIEFPKLQEIGGTLTLGTNRNANNITFPLLKKLFFNRNYFFLEKLPHFET